MLCSSWIWILIVLLSVSSQAFAAPQRTESTLRALEIVQKASEDPWDTVWSGDRVRWLTAGRLILGTTDPVEAGRRFLTAHGAVLGLTTPLTETRLRDVKRGKAITRLDYDQIYNGTRVIDGRLVLTVDRSGALCSLHSSIRIPQSIPRRSILLIAPDDAVQAVLAGLKIRSLRGPVARNRAILIERGQPREVWEVRVPSAEPLGDFVVLVDAATGRLLHKRDLLCRLDGTGRVFDPNPVVTLRNTHLKDEDDSASAVPENAYRTVPLPDIDPSGILWGPYVNVFSPDGRATEPGLQFLYDRADDRFEQVMAYFHIDRNHRYLTSLGYDSVVNFSLSVKTDADNEDQSFYSPFTKEILFGAGGVDDAEDADIIIHEYGHAIQYDQIPGFGSAEETKAMGEGFGDYWAFSNDSNGTFNREVIGDWDAVAYSTEDPPYLRRVDEEVRYPDDLIHDIHEDGRIWSHALYDIWNGLGKTITDTLVIESHFAITPDATFFDGAEAIYEIDRVLYGGAHLEQIFKAFDDRGLAAATLSKSHLNVVAGEKVEVPFTQAVLGGPATLHWEQIAGPSAENRIIIGNTLSFIAPDPPNQDLKTDLVFRLYAERSDQVISYNDLGVTVFGHSVLFDTPERSIEIPDDSARGITRTFEYSGSGPVSQILVYVDVDHSYRGDLRVELTSPSGTKSILVPDSSKPGKGLELVLYASQTAGDVDRLEPFLGEEAQGLWTLRVSDLAAADTGSLRRWALGIQTGEPPQPTPIPIDLRNGSALYREDFESDDLSETGFIAYPGGLDGSFDAGRAFLGTPTWVDPDSRDGNSLILSAAPGEVITVVLDPSHAISNPSDVFLSVRVSSSGAGATIAVALVEQTFDGSIGYLSPMDSSPFKNSWSTLHTYFSPSSGAVLPILQIANRTGSEEISVAFDHLLVYPVQVRLD